MYKTFYSCNNACGISLFITKKQVGAMGGHTVDSEPGVGFTFFVFFKNNLPGSNLILFIAIFN